MADQGATGVSGFELDLRPQYKAAVALQLSPELKAALVEAQRAGRTASLRFSRDARGQVGRGGR
jgi:hypothetical protein